MQVLQAALTAAKDDVEVTQQQLQQQQELNQQLQELQAQQPSPEAVAAGKQQQEQQQQHLQQMHSRMQNQVRQQLQLQMQLQKEVAEKEREVRALRATMLALQSELKAAQAAVSDRAARNIRDERDLAALRSTVDDLESELVGTRAAAGERTARDAKEKKTLQDALAHARQELQQWQAQRPRQAGADGGDGASASPSHEQVQALRRELQQAKDELARTQVQLPPPSFIAFVMGVLLLTDPSSRAPFRTHQPPS